MDDGSISMTTIKIIKRLVPKGGSILELGSGLGTQYLVDEGYLMTSIEHDEGWIDKFDSDYIYAPIKDMKPVERFPEFDKWYSYKHISDRLIFDEVKYDMLLVDGPPRFVDGVKVGRAGLVKWRALFNWQVPVIFDDTQREGEWRIAYNIARRLECGRSLITYDTGQRKLASVMLQNWQHIDKIKDLL